MKVRAILEAGGEVDFASAREIRAIADGLRVEEGGEGWRFVEAVEGIVREEEGAVLLVTHREGIRELDRLCGAGRMTTPYCSVHEYDFDLDSGKWRLVHDSVIRKPAGGSRYRDILQDYQFAFEEEKGKAKSYSRCDFM